MFTFTFEPMERNINCISFCPSSSLISAGGKLRLLFYNITDDHFIILDDSGRVYVWSLNDYTLLQAWRDNSKMKVQGIVWLSAPHNRNLLCIVALRGGTLQVWGRAPREVNQ